MTVKHMMNARGNILWIDDEIEHLKPHILFLEEKGYAITRAGNGYDALELSKVNAYDLILLDQSMPGMDGIEILTKLKNQRKSHVVIMITKTEDEWLMNEAITEQVEQFLTKPVNPSQIFMACKQALEKNQIRQDSDTSKYLNEFQKIELTLGSNKTVDDWYLLYDNLVDWQIRFDSHRDIGLEDILEDQIRTCNKEFSYFIEKNYENWLLEKSGPTFTKDIVKKYVYPFLKKNEKVCLLVIDCLRFDHFKVMAPILETIFDIQIDYSLSLLPSATPYSRNAIFSGLFPDQIVEKYPNQARDMQSDVTSLNKYEEQFITDQLVRLNLKNKSIHYHKIWAANEGNKFAKSIGNYNQKDFLSLVVNFVDILAHKSSQLEVLKEIVPNESGYRSAIKIWFEQSWLLKVLKYLSDNNFKIILTSDHGSVRVQNDVMVLADKHASTGVRYKYGRNLNTNSRNVIVVKDPDKYRLPAFGPQPTYLIAKNDSYFVYPNEASKYQEKFKNTFQHGGVSMEELIIPIVTMQSKT